METKKEEKSKVPNVEDGIGFDVMSSDPVELDPGKATFFTYCLVLCICVGGFLFGYDTGVISGALQPIKEDFSMNTVTQELVVGGTTFGAIFGGFFAGILSDRFGRKPLILSSSVVFIAGALLLALPQTYAQLLVGRLVVGFAVGAASMVVPVYIGEVSPKQIRGRLTTLNTMMVTFGQVIAYVINIAFANVDNGWRYMFGLAGIPALIQLVMMPFMPESPRRQVAIGRPDLAKECLRRIYGKDVHDKFLEAEIASIEEEVQISRSASFKDFRFRQNWMPLVIACVLQAAQQLSGFNTAMYYAATILRMAGFRSHQDSTTVAIIVSATNMVFTAVAVLALDRVGRRRMLVVSMVVVVAGLIALGGTFAGQQGFVQAQNDCSGYATNCARCVLDDSCGWSIQHSTCMNLNQLEAANDLLNTKTGCPAKSNDSAITGLLLFFLIVYVAAYALGLGYAPWVVQSEIFPLSVRGKGNGISTAVNWICNLIISTTFLSMTNTMTVAGTFWFYAGLSIILWIAIFFIVPETSKRSLEEMQALFNGSG